ncbi:MAG: FliH/SctL family protein [Gemmatimonadota bacterium]
MDSFSRERKTPSAAHWLPDELDAHGTACGGGSAENEALHLEELEEAYRRGRAQGEEAARDAARRELATALAAARKLMQGVQEQREAWESNLEERMVALSAAVARHLVDREMKDDPSFAVEVVHKAIALFLPDEPLRVRVHPEDLLLLRQADLERSSGNEGAEVPSPGAEVAAHEIRWVPDEEMIRGGCVVEGPDKVVDGRVGEALERIYQRLSRA